MWWYRKPSSIHSDDFLESYPENPFSNKNYQNFRLSLIMKANKKLKMFFSWSISNLVGWKFNLYHLLLNWSSIFPSNHKLNREQSRSHGVCSGKHIYLIFHFWKTSFVTSSGLYFKYEELKTNLRTLQPMRPLPFKIFK